MPIMDGAIKALFGKGRMQVNRQMIPGHCDHVWRQNVAWSHLERCDGCGTDRPKPHA